MTWSTYQPDGNNMVRFFRSFFTSQKLREHIDKHYNMKQYECKECNKQFVNALLLKKHLDSHQKYICPFCMKHCEGVALLEDHIKKDHQLQVKVQVSR